MRSSTVFVLGLFLSILASGASGLAGLRQHCVSKSVLATTCGSAAGAPCKQESATRVCFGRQSALAAPKPAQTQ